MTGNRPIIEFMTFNFALLVLIKLSTTLQKSVKCLRPILSYCFSGPSLCKVNWQRRTHKHLKAGTPTSGLKVIVPSNPYDAKGLLKAAIRDDDPVIFMESEQMYGDKGEVPEDEYILPIGVADIKRKGTDVTTVCFGKIIKEAIPLQELAKEGIECEIIDLRTVRPMDHNAIFESVKKTNRLVI